MINPMKLMQLKPLWGKFQKNHPKFRQFISAAGKAGVQEGSVIEIQITTTDGKTLSTNLKLTKDDVEMIHTISEIARG